MPVARIPGLPVVAYLPRFASPEMTQKVLRRLCFAKNMLFGVHTQASFEPASTSHYPREPRNRVFQGLEVSAHLPRRAQLSQGGRWPCIPGFRIVSQLAESGLAKAWCKSHSIPGFRGVGPLPRRGPGADNPLL